MKKLVRDYLIMIIGAIVIGIGVAFIVSANVGGDAMTTFEQGLTQTFHISLPIAMIIANGIFVVLLLVFAKDNISIDTVLSPLFISAGSKVGLLFMPSLDDMIIRYVFFFIGLCTAGVGIAIGAQSETGSNPYDGFVLALSKKINKSYSIVRPVLDAGLLVIGILLKGTFGVGTFIAIFCMGPVANFFIKMFAKIIH
ncbi:MAG: hypothetical protein MR458_01245 [Erysipelotrichaceae bacterium]|nr:hypothetical protein [Erysipelotrichaceae bacterium]